MGGGICGGPSGYFGRDSAYGCEHNARARFIAGAGARPDSNPAERTLSIGVASYSADRLNNAASFIEAADLPLYAAKRGGRDCVMLGTELRSEYVIQTSQYTVKIGENFRLVFL